MRTRDHIHAPGNFGAKAADLITAFAGSWLCVAIHTAWFVAWFALRLDINLLTLIVSLEAIYLATLVMMSQNRQAERDRKRDDHEADEVDLLYSINQQQLDILQFLHEGNLLARLDMQDQQINRIVQVIEARKAQKKALV